MHQFIHAEDSNMQLEHTDSYSPYQDYIKERLYEWAGWYSRCDFYRIGYPSRTLEDRLMVEGAIIHSTAPKSFPQNPEAEEIEDYLNEMFHQEPEMAIAIRWKYFFPNDSLRKQAAQLTELGFSMTYALVQALLAKSHAWLEGRMTAKQKYNHLWISKYSDPNHHAQKLCRNMDRYIH